MVFQNIQSVGNKLHLLEQLLSNNATIDILSLSEMVRNKYFCNSISLPGYKLASLCCRETHQGGGVSIFVKESLEFIERKDIVNFSKEFIIEFCAIEIPKLNCIFIGLYRADRHLNIFYEQIEKVLEKLKIKDQNKYIIIGGDFNINVMEKDKKVKDFLSLMHIYNLHQLIKEPTRVTNVSSKCIDLLFTNHKPLINKSYVENYGLSDHKAIVTKLNLKYLLDNDNKIWYKKQRKFTDSKIWSFKNSLKEVCWENIISKNKNVNENYKLFLTQVIHLLNINIPIQKI